MSEAITMLLMIGSMTAQQQPAPPSQVSQPAAATAAKQDHSQKVSCRITMEGNMPRRVCMTNGEWAKVDSGNSGSSDQPYINPGRCTLGAC